MLTQLTSSELMEWQEYYTIEPFGGVRDDLHAAVVASTIANVNRGERTKAYEISDFMLDFTKDPNKGQSQKVLEHNLMAFMHAHNRSVDKRNGK